jgi:c-di-AMP phosphodiesterase-like protein
MEKNTRVKARVKANALQEIITSKDRVLVMGHRLGDADAFGASVGISCIARALGRKSHIVINDITTSVKPLVELFKDKNTYDEDFIISSLEALELADNNTVLVVVDVNKPSITECPELIKACKTVVVLDHHRQSSEVIDNATLSYVEPYASSTCEMVAEILQYIAGTVKVKSSEADCMYSGIMIDTNNFTAKTGVRTFEAAAFLRRCGADVTRVRKMFRDGVAEYKAKAAAVSGAEIYRNSYALGICPTEGLDSPTEIGAQASNELLGINGIKASFVMTPYNGKVYISARSIDEVNVQIIMERLGGGGHMNIAGAQIADISPQTAILIVKQTLDSMIEDGSI